MTGDRGRRVDEHKHDMIKRFAQKYKMHTLVYYEIYDSPDEVIRREKNMKAWKRSWKLRLIESVDPNWNDLSSDLL
jgi:putative endonuclease